jgi:CelD/BcsL family acetyltransferase involved in cellulose biosynthesis
MDALVQLHQARWQSKGEPGAFSPTFEAFLRDAMRDALRTSRLALWTLAINGRIEAALVGFIDNGVLHYFQKGFNPAFEKDDLGTVMLALSLRASFDDPTIRSFDFMGGGAAYKDMWARQSNETLVCEIERPTVGAALFTAWAFVRNLAHTAYHRLVPMSLRAWRRDWLRRRRLRTHLVTTPLPAHVSD